MYSIVLVMALSNGAATPTWQGGEDHFQTKQYGAYGHREYRHRRNGCCGGCYGGSYGGCHGCCGGWSGGCCGGGGYMGTPGGYMKPMPGEKPREKLKPSKDGDKEQEIESLPAPARIIVTLPADAKLIVSGQTTTSTSSQRVFESPDLERGKDFQYTFVAEVTRQGQRLTESKQIVVRAGKETRLAFDFSAASVARK